MPMPRYLPEAASFRIRARCSSSRVMAAFALGRAKERSRMGLAHRGILAGVTHNSLTAAHVIDLRDGARTCGPASVGSAMQPYPEV